MVVQGDDDELAFDAPTDVIETVRLAPIYAIVGRFEGDEVLTWACEMRGQFSSAGGVIASLVRREKTRLEERFPNTFVLTAQPMSLTKPKPWRLNVLFARHPAETFELQPVPVDEIVAPVAVRPTGEAISELPSAELSIVDARGKSVDLSGLFVDVSQPPSEFMVEVPPNQTIRLPAGEYPLRTYDSFVRSCLPPSTLRVPGRTVITLDREFRKCRLTFPDGGDAASQSGHVSWTVAGLGSKALFGVDCSRPRELWLPVGPVTIDFGVTEDESTSREFEVVASAENDVQEILLR